MTARTAHMPGPAEFEIETRGMAIAADLLNSKGLDESARVVMQGVVDRQREFRDAMEGKA